MFTYIYIYRGVSKWVDNFFENLCRISTKKTKFPKIEEGRGYPRSWDSFVYIYETREEKKRRGAKEIRLKSTYDPMR